jgi:hypothetical protein
MSIGVYMKNKTFPFQTEISNDKINTIGFIEMLQCIEALNILPEDSPMAEYLKDYQLLENTGFSEFNNILESDSSNDSWPLNNCYGGKENLYLKVFVTSLKSQLKSSEFNETNVLLTKELDSIEYAVFHNDQDIGDLFASVQESILKTGTGDIEISSTLYDLVFNNDIRKLSHEEKQVWQCTIYYLFKFIPKDIDAICSLFEKLNANKENIQIKICYGLIGSYGMRVLANLLIQKHGPDPATVSNLRRYSALFTTAFDLLFSLPVSSKTYTKKASELIVLSLIKSAYKMGTIDREKDFYSEDSLDFMCSLGTSLKSNIGHKIKYQKCEKFAEEAEELWKAGDKRLHNEMADYLLKKHQPKKEDKNKKNDKHLVSKTLLLERLKEVAKKYGRVRGVKKQ